MATEQNVRKLSKGIQSFEELYKNKLVYVDKTDMVWKIANGDKNNFLSRPRRFGKSLLTSTLKCYFEGREDMFENLKIMEFEHEWPKRAVFQFDFSGCITREDLEININKTLSRYESIYGRPKGKSNFNSRMFELMQKACDKTGHQVAVLVDEYDSPLQEALNNKARMEKMAEVYRGFFPVMKTGEEYIKCLFLTGITKFTQLSLFSVLNNVTILSSNPNYATVCGITRQEIIDNYMPELEAMGKVKGWTVEQTIEELRDMYDGYCFSNDLTKTVYNPFSLICALSEKKLSHYWSYSGAGKMLNDILVRNLEKDKKFENIIIPENKLDLSDVSLKDADLFLYQTGYLTIKGYRQGGYILGIPNNEVKAAMFNIVLPNIVHEKESDVNAAIVQMQWALEDGDVAKMMEYLKLVIAQTPYPTRKDEKLYEERFRYMVDGALRLCGCLVQPEMQISTGRIDIVARFRNIVLVIELKLDNNGGLEAAKKQIVEKNYTASFPKDKDVYAIAINCSTDDKIRGIESYDITKIQ